MLHYFYMSTEKPKTRNRNFNGQPCWRCIITNHNSFSMNFQCCYIQGNLATISLFKSNIRLLFSFAYQASNSEYWWASTAVSPCCVLIVLSDSFFRKSHKRISPCVLPTKISQSMLISTNNTQEGSTDDLKKVKIEIKSVKANRHANFENFEFPCTKHRFKMILMKIELQVLFYNCLSHIIMHTISPIITSQ